MKKMYRYRAIIKQEDLGQGRSGVTSEGGYI